jgi:hypothetical protein
MIWFKGMVMGCGTLLNGMGSTCSIVRGGEENASDILEMHG